jgi:hypothetical protein
VGRQSSPFERRAEFRHGLRMVRFYGTASFARARPQIQAQARQRCGVVLRRPRSDAHGCACSGPRCHSCARPAPTRPADPPPSESDASITPQLHTCSRTGHCSYSRCSAGPSRRRHWQPEPSWGWAAEACRLGAPTIFESGATQSINLSFILMIQFLILLSRRLSQAPCPQVGYCALRMRKVSLPPCVMSCHALTRRS